MLHAGEAVSRTLQTGSKMPADVSYMPLATLFRAAPAMPLLPLLLRRRHAFASMPPRYDADDAAYLPLLDAADAATLLR